MLGLLLRELLLLLRFGALPEDLSILSLLGQKATRAAATAYEEQNEGYDDDADNDPDDLDQAEKEDEVRLEGARGQGESSKKH